MQKKQVVNSLLLALTALIWGSAFVAQSVGMDFLGPLSFNGARNVLAALALIPVIAVMDRKNQGSGRPQGPQQRRTLWQGGVACGLVLAAATTVQQLGIQYASVGKAGFITALYIVIVPVLGTVFLRQRSGAQVWGGVLLALVGLYLLCAKDGDFSMGKGEVLLLISSLLFSLHILVIDRYSPLVDGVRLSWIQFVVVAALCMPLGVLLEHPSLHTLLAAWGPLLYAGVLSSAVGYTLQIVGQRNVPPTVASLILSLESVFAALAGWVLLHQVLTGRELLGCGLMFAAILLAQLPARADRKPRPQPAEQ